MTTTLLRQHEMTRAIGAKMTNLVVALVLVVKSKPPYCLHLFSNEVVTTWLVLRVTSVKALKTERF